MKNFLKLIPIIFLIVLAYGCAYSVPSSVAPAINVYSSYEDKIPGSVVLVIDENVKNISHEVKPSSYVCSAHKFPLTLGSALEVSIKQTTDSIFENVIEQNNLPTMAQMLQVNSQGVIYVKLNRFEPKINFSMGFWSGSAKAECDIALDVTVKDASNKSLMTTSIGGSRSADGDSGGACGNGANVLSDAISKSMREVMERYAERISNSEKIRTAFKQKVTKSETQGVK